MTSKGKNKIQADEHVQNDDGSQNMLCPDEDQEDQSPLAPTSCGRDGESCAGASDYGSTDGSPGATYSRSSSGGEASPSKLAPDAELRGSRGKNKVDPPPAIEEEQADTTEDKEQEPKGPSRGSTAHEEGTCSPCVWNWKPQGCTRGQECGFCHLCPEGEIKNRKKAKLANIRGGSTGSLEWLDSKEAPEEPKEAQPDALRTPQATPGSSLHGTGGCRPCAWFYKAQGCQNGAECRHCHLCPEGEIKSRKKNKTDTLRTDKDRGGTSRTSKQSSQGEGESPLKAGSQAQSSLAPHTLADLIPPPPGLSAPAVPQALPSVGSVLHGTGECRPCAWFYKPQGCQNAAECRHCHLCPDGEIKSRRRAKALGMRNGSGSQNTISTTGTDDTDSEDEGEEVQKPQKTVGENQEAVKVMLPLASRQQPRGELPSVGAALHGTGECRPCAWFHKPQGCENGAECRHCHLCPEGEIRDRRKNKVAALKKKGSGDSDIDVEAALWAVQKQQEALLVAHMQAQAVQEQWEMAAYALSPMGLDFSAAISAMALSAAAAVATASVAAVLDTTPVSLMSNSPACFNSPDSKGLTPVKVITAEAFPEPSTPLGNMPSTGSSLHSLGKCRPCAWFHKTQGCQNGQACAHCHLCPEGELKERKRVKEAAMRMGAIEPVRLQGSPNGRSPGHARSPRVVKIAPILGA